MTIILIPITFLINDRLQQPGTTAMYVCVCKGITDTQIRAAVQDGASSLREIRNSLGVASQCGKCGILTRQIVRESLSDQVDNQQLFYAVS